MRLFGIDGNPGDGVVKTLCSFGWGMVFVLAMTVLSVWGDRMAHARAASAAATTIASQPAVASIR
jgi:quinol-cytochrome oxidoreductase complex cytochrome b subunit